jgi:hypothetical protein
MAKSFSARSGKRTDRRISALSWGVLGRAAELTISEMRSKGDAAGPRSFFFLVGLALVDLAHAAVPLGQHLAHRRNEWARGGAFLVLSHRGWVQYSLTEKGGASK